MSEPQKVMSLRIPQRMSREIEIIAMVQQQPIVEVIRLAIAEYITSYKDNEEFQANLKAWFESAKDMMTT